MPSPIISSRIKLRRHYAEVRDLSIPSEVDGIDTRKTGVRMVSNRQREPVPARVRSFDIIQRSPRLVHSPIPTSSKTFSKPQRTECANSFRRSSKKQSPRLPAATSPSIQMTVSVSPRITLPRIDSAEVTQANAPNPVEIFGVGPLKTAGV